SVQPMEALVLTADRSVEFGPGAPVYLPHQLINTGNTPSQYTFDVEDLGGDYHLEDIHLYRDLNGNGWWDSGEPEIISNETVISLNPDESLDIVVAGIIPVNA